MRLLSLLLRVVVYLLRINCQYLATICHTYTHPHAYRPLEGELLYRFRIKVAARVACCGCSIWNAIAASGNISFCNSQGYARPHPGKALENCEKQKAWQAIKIATKPTKRSKNVFSQNLRSAKAKQKVLNARCSKVCGQKRTLLASRANKSVINWSIKYPRWVKFTLYLFCSLELNWKGTSYELNCLRYAAFNCQANRPLSKLLLGMSEIC